MSLPLMGLDELLDHITRFIRRFVVLTDDQAAAVALWVAHTWAFDAAEATPYLSITSAEKRSGKTRVLEVLELVVRQPWRTGKLSAAVLHRKIAAETPTLLLDESDAAFGRAKEYGEELRGVLNDGYRQGGKATVCVGQGASIAYKDFSVFCPKAIAGIGKLPDTIADRSIPIRVKRKKRSEQAERFRLRKIRAEASDLTEALATWADGPDCDALGEAWPELPESIDDRAQDVWEPLLAIADLAAGAWPVRARRAAQTLSASAEPDDDSVTVRLLADCQGAFTDGEGHVLTEDLLGHLHSLDEAPWRDWYGKPLSGKKLGDLLSGFGIKSKDFKESREGKAKALKGYPRTPFEDAWERYLPPKVESKRDKRDNGSVEPKADTLQSATEVNGRGSENGRKPLGKAKVADVADSEARNEAEDRFLEAAQELVNAGEAEWVK